MRFDLLVLNGTIVSSRETFDADIGVVGGTIVEIGSLSNADAAEKLDAKGLHVLPGIIDTQVHFREPGMEHKEDLESGTRAALMGGVTSILEMPNTSPPTTSRASLEDKLERAKDRAWCNYGFFVGASAENADELRELEALPGTPGIKIFMGSSTGSLLVADDETLERVLRNGSRPCPVHAEDSNRLEERKALMSSEPTVHEHPFLRDPECALLATRRLVSLSERTGRPVHVLHVSTADELPLIEAAKDRGVRVTAEVTPQHLFFAAPECYDKLGSLAQMNPPLRGESHRSAIRAAVADGLFDVIGSDHAPHTAEEKAKPYPQSPSGMPGVQTLVPVMLDFVNKGLIDLGAFVRLACEAPADLYGIRSKGRIATGHDADLCLADLSREQSVEKNWLQSKCGWSPYEGITLNGWPVHVVIGGKVGVRDQQLQGAALGAALEYGWKRG